MKNRMLSRGLQSMILAAWLLGPAAAAAELGEGVADIASHMERLERLGFAGALVIVEAGEPLLVGSYGLAERETGRMWSPATVSTVGSITKQFTGAAILALVEEGKVATTDLISEYFESVPPDKQSITLHQLLTHSSGIVDLDGLDDWDPIGREEFILRAMAQELAFEPGTSYDYSNAGYSLLGAIIEQVTGMSYESYVRQRLLLPAGMFETGYVLPQWGSDRLAQGYQAGELWGTVLGRPMAEDGPYWVLRANGGIQSTVWDMVRWADALLDGRVLSADSMEKYWAPHVDEGGGDSFYGYGWVVADWAGTKVITHNGGNGIFFADLAIVPDARLVVFLMTNVVAELGVANQLLEQIGARLIAGETLPTVPEIVDADPGSLAPFQGRYSLDGGGSFRANVVEERLDLEADDGRAFATLLSTRPVDLERAERLSGRLEEISSALLAGDFNPLWEAYGRSGTLESLTDQWSGRLAALTESNGPLSSHVVLGTAFRDGRDVTLLRLDYRDGPVYRAFVWDPDEDEALLGVSFRGLDPILHLYPVAAGGFASWDSRSGATIPVRIEAAGDAVRMTIGQAPGAAAVKAE